LLSLHISVGTIFPARSHCWIFTKIFPRGAEVVKFGFSTRKYENKIFAETFKLQGTQGPSAPFPNAEMLNVDSSRETDAS